MLIPAAKPSKISVNTINPLTIVHILCPGHSGSTLLDLLLGSHSQVVSVGEIKWFKQTSTESAKEVTARKCMCGAPTITNCPFWRDVEIELNRSAGLCAVADLIPTNTEIPKVENMKQLSKTEERTLKHVHARTVLNVLNVPRITDEAVEVIVKNSGVIYKPVVCVCDENGEERLGAGDRPMEFRALAEEILQSPDSEDSRKLRWKPFGRPI